jgi:hypothetical protein
MIVKICFHSVTQACQTQTALLAEKATKTAEGAEKNAQKFLCGLDLTKFRGLEMTL